MATLYVPLDPDSAHPSSSSYPEYKIIAGTNAPEWGHFFDASSTETNYYKCMARNYASTPVCLIHWYADTASSGDVVWEVKIMALTSETDTQDVETDAWATAQTVTDSHLGTTGQRLHTASITISNTDSLADGDFVRFAISRLGGNGSDTMTGDACIAYAEFSYTST